MSNATELLNSVTEEEISAYTADSESEPHIVVNSDRTITVPASLKKIAVQHDHKVETVTFDCPRYWDGYDMSKWHVWINYTLSNGYEDSYLADNVVVDDTDETIMHFDWTISRNVTQVAGNITILICIKEADEDNEAEDELGEYDWCHWNSERNSELTVSSGMECTEQTVDKHPDIINGLLSRMDETEKMVLDTLPETTEEDNGKTWMVVNGELQLVKFPAGTQYDAKTITIPASSWNDNGSQIHAISYDFDKYLDECHVNVSLTASSTKEQITEAARCGVYCSAASGMEMTFTALYAMPTIDLTFDVLITKPTTLSYSLDEENMIMTIVEE